MDLKKFSGDWSQVDFLNLMMVDLGGNLRSVTLPREYATEKVLKDGVGFDASNYGYAKVSNSDMVAIPDMSRALIEERSGFRTVHVFCDVVSADDSRTPFAQYPRNVVKAAVKHLREKGIADDAKMLVELEYYAFDKAEYTVRPDCAAYRVGTAEGLGEGFETEPRFPLFGGYHRLSPQDRYRDFRDATVRLLEAAGIPVKYHHHEVAAGQLEIELDFTSIADTADDVTLAKWIIRTVAAEMGLHATFMPKPMNGVSGSGMHVHQFLTKDGRSLFPGDGVANLSPLALSYTAGLLSHAQTGALLAFTNPSTNSFRRLVPGFEAPISATFAKGSRCAAVRIPSYLKKDSTRIEYRPGDATANVYFMLAAMVMAGCDGIAHGLDPVAMGMNSPEIEQDKVFPLNLNAVLDGLEEDHVWAAPVFPEALIEQWIKAKRAEAAYVYNAPTPQEYELYFGA